MSDKPLTVQVLDREAWEAEQRSAQKRYALTIKAVDKKLDVSHTQIHRMVNAGTLPQPIKIGGRVLFIEDQIDALFVQAS